MNTYANPPPPAGWVRMKQAQVTSEMTQFAASLVHSNEPMHSEHELYFVVSSGEVLVGARLEWHTYTHCVDGSIVYRPGIRGCTLYVVQCVNERDGQSLKSI